ncbi:hypothetical protein Poly51_24160 [Rubripirellula tenax]|uniref:Uncharacterized protein n=1 Tax=Rubripirellula tenax TaxID=2528015 RepID=A0A5C6F5J4_9BACT|nr:hypothetical protein [Rubripirellula tenax]TWU56505.1 hypothetical protein Poly51_24160 [Rubripirellula tenax]
MNDTTTTKCLGSDDIETDQQTTDDCEAMIVCLNTRRFVIVRPSEKMNVWPCEGGWERIRQIHTGDRVIYQGKISIVRAVEVYR